jgi:ABC-type transport system involved in multi-copper enzyme maturation permease subunit
MFTGVLALLERSLRIDARAWGPHLARFGLMAAIYIAVCYASATSNMFGAPGLRFFTSIAYLNLVFMTLLGISFFSTAVTEEKEEDTLGLMLMAGISPLGILMGKSGGRLFQALLLIAVQYPFTLLAVTLGGVTKDQVWSTTLGMLAYMVMLAGIGMLCSTIAHRNRSASFRLVLVIIVYWLIPLLSNRLLIEIGTKVPYLSKTLGVIGESCIFIQMGTILTTGFHETLWSRQVVTNLCVGVLSFVLSWALFGLAVREPATEAATRGLLTRSRRFQLFTPSRPWSEPMIWKDFYFISGGIGTVLVRFALYILLVALSMFITYGFLGGARIGNPEKQAHALFLVLAMFGVSLDAALVVSRSLHEEVRSQTLATLMLLPRSTGMILYGKIIGSLLGWLPGPICLLLGMISLPYGPENVSDFFKGEGAAVWLVSHLILVPHAAAALAMFVRWGALPLAIGLAFGSLFLSVSIFQAVRANHNDPIVWVVIFVVLAVSAACHVVVWLKAESVCAR